MLEMLIAIADFFTKTLGSQLFQKTGVFIANIAPIFSIAFGLYLLLLVFYYYNRGLDESILDISKRLIGWLVVISLAFNAGTYAHLANILYQFPDDMAGWFDGSKLDPSALKTSIDAINNILSKLVSTAGNADWDDLITPLVCIFAIFVVWVSGAILVVLIYGLYLIAKVLLAMVLMVGPIFIGLMLFPATRQYGMNWIGQVFNYAVTVTLYAVVTILQTSFAEGQLQKMGNDQLDNVANIVALLFTLIPLTIIFILVILQVPSVASALTGGASVSGGGRALGKMASVGSKGIATIKGLMGKGGSNSAAGK